MRLSRFAPIENDCYRICFYVLRSMCLQLAHISRSTMEAWRVLYVISLGRRREESAPMPLAYCRIDCHDGLGFQTTASARMALDAKLAGDSDHDGLALRSRRSGANPSGSLTDVLRTLGSRSVPMSGSAALGPA
jgi:hypothetical protein